MRYTVKQLARLAGVTGRTLRYYDEIGLLRPAETGENGYRYYNDASVLRLQQILFYRELDFPLEQIQELLNRPDFDLLHALESHRLALQDRVRRLNRLIQTVDHTIEHLQGERTMSNQDFYAGFDEEQQKKHAQEAEQRWGETAAQSQKRWEGYTRQQKNDILAQMHEITNGIAAGMEQGPESPAVQQWVARWHQHINAHFYACSLETFAALGRMYTDDPAFEATYEKVRLGLAAFTRQAMEHYVAQQT